MFPSLPEYASLSDVFSKFPARSKAVFPLLQNIMREPSAFSSAERELIAAYVSKLDACDYCASAHKGMALALGLKIRGNNWGLTKKQIFSQESNHEQRFRNPECTEPDNSGL